MASPVVLRRVKVVSQSISGSYHAGTGATPYNGRRDAACRGRTELEAPAASAVTKCRSRQIKASWENCGSGNGAQA